MVVGWFLFIYFWPSIVLHMYKRAILVKGFGDGPIPVNTLHTVGWLDLSKGPLVLHVPDMASRYYSVQFTDPSNNTIFAYVGKRTTGTEAGEYLVSGPGWKGTMPQGMTQISSPNNSVLVLGRVFVESDSDLSTAYNLAKRIQLTPQSRWRQGQ